MSEPADPLFLPLHGSRLVEASAGTGKTWTIAALYLRLVLGHGTARAFMPGEILVVTFTKAATRELSDRIRKRLVQAAACLRGEAQPPEDDAFLAALLAHYRAAGTQAQAKAAWCIAMAAEAMDDAAVFTIDAWCQRMLREHAFDSGCLFDEELQANETAVREQAVHDVWRQEIYPLTGSALAQALHAWPTVYGLLEAVKGLFDKPLPEGAGEGTLGECIERAVARRAEALLALKAGWVGRAAEMLAWLEQLWARKDKPSDGRKLGPSHVRRWLQALAAWAEDPMATTPDVKGGATRLTPDGIRESFKPGVCIDLPACFGAFEALMQALQQLPDPQAAALAHVAARVTARTQQLKAQAGRYGFADMLERLDQALDEAQRGDKARHLREGILKQFPVALVDEFQDTSPVQLRIFDRLYRIAENDGESALLLIGDPKQAIYGFRGADIHSYLQARRATAGRHHALGTNHRSTTALVAAVNGLFGAAERRAGAGAFLFREAGREVELPFVDVQARGLAARLVTSAGEVPAMTMCVDAEPRGVRESRECLADLCAERIVQVLGDAAAGFAGVEGGRRDERDERGDGGDGGEGTFKPLRPGDIAVLVRTGREAEAVRRALQRRGVASVYLSDKDSVFATDEARDLLRLLQAAAAPRDVRLARAALATSLIGFGLDELLAMAGDDMRFDARCELLAELHGTWQSQGVLAMLRRGLHGLDMPARWLAPGRGGRADLIAGQRRLTNVMHLAELLQAQSATVEGMQALIRWLAQQVEQAGLAQIGPAEDEQVLRLESDADLVQVITVHRAKGLEYDWVFLPFAAHFRAERNAAFVYLPDAQGRRHLSMPPSAAQLEEADRERLREDLRLLYVALTRARHALWVGVGAPYGKSMAWHGSALGVLISGPDERAPEQVRADLQDLRAVVPGLVIEPAEPVFVGDVPRTPSQASAGPAAPALRPAPVYAAQFDRAWTVSSYSALVRAASDGARAAAIPAPSETALRLLRDDEPVGGEGEEREGSASAPTALEPWHRFPRGALPGNFLHDQLEWLAGEGFALDTSLELQSALVRRCERQGWGHRAADVVVWLRRVCTAPLPGIGVVGGVGVNAAGADTEGGTPLAQLDHALPEMEFWFPSDGLRAGAVDALCRRHVLPGRPRPPLAERTLHGMLMGFADLVLEHGGRYAVLDYKSNALGSRDADYTPAAMQAAMLEHRYDVQAVLYLLALHRLLRGRLGAAYAPAQHLHGAIYLFLRGVQGPGRGCFHVPPPMELIDALDAMLTSAPTLPPAAAGRDRA